MSIPSNTCRQKDVHILLWVLNGAGYMKVKCSDGVGLVTAGCSAYVSDETKKHWM